MFQIFELNHNLNYVFEVTWARSVMIQRRRAIGHIMEGVNNNLIIADISICQEDIPPARVQTALWTILLAWDMGPSISSGRAIQELMWGKNVNYPRLHGEMCGQVNKKLYRLFSLD